MEEKHFDLLSYKLHTIKTNKFKDINILISFKREIKKEDITIREIISNMLLLSNQKYKNNKEISIKLEDLYNGIINIENIRIGNYISTNFYLNILSNKYTDDNNFENSLEFLKDIIFNYNFNDDKNIEISKKQVKNNISSLVEDARSYSIIRANSIYENSKISYQLSGYLKDLESISKDDINNYYKTMFTKDLIDIYIVGDIKDSDYKLIKKYFKFRHLINKKKSFYLNDDLGKKIISKKETIPNRQSNITLILDINKPTKYEKDIVIPIFNLIFGGWAEAKLFREIREEKSLCYTIFSSYKRLDNKIYILSGIDKSNYDETIKGINKCLNDMKKSKFSDENINNAVNYYINSLNQNKNKSTRLLDYLFNKDITDDLDMDEKEEKLKKVTRNEIVKLAKKINIKTYFLLEGDNCE